MPGARTWSPGCRIVGRTVFTSTAFKGAMRGFGSPQYAFIQESMMDEVAMKLGMDALDLRIKNGVKGGDVIITGQKRTTTSVSPNASSN